MIPIENIAKKIQDADHAYEYSICTLVTRLDQYQTMLSSFIDAGFSQEKCEYLYIDNSKENLYDAYAAFNIFLQRAQGKYIIICHQDIELLYDKIDVLEKRICELEKIDPKWAVAGNAGGINLNYTSWRITHGTPPLYKKIGNCFPHKVETLDENFILVKNNANLAVSSDLKGFHFYGTDICLIAYTLGFTAYLIDFHLYHKSGGNKDESFFSMKMAFQKKYQRALKGHYINTMTKERFYISGSRFYNFIFNSYLIKKIIRKYFKLRFILKGSY